MKSILSPALIAAGLSLVAPCFAQIPGSSDPQFGIGGRLSLSLGNGNDEIHAVTPLRDGRFLVAGQTVGPNNHTTGHSPNLLVARFLADGRRDPGFGNDGVWQMDLEAGIDFARAMTVLPDRSLLIAGRLSPGAYGDIGLVKLRPDGTLDTGFGMTVAGQRQGFNLFDIGGPAIHDEATAIAVQRDGRIVVAGITRVVVGGGLYARGVLARFTADGLPDPSFGSGGTGYTILPAMGPNDGGDHVTGIALTARGGLAGDDRITVVGHTVSRNNAFVARFTANGTADSSFGDPLASGGRTGVVTFSATSSSGVHRGVATVNAARLLADGRIVLTGSGSDRGVTFLRLTAQGGLDTSFGVDGRRTVKFSSVSDYDEPAALAVQGNGRLVAAGYATNRATGAPRSDFFLARLNADGSVDHGFGDGQGRVVVPVAPGTDEAYALAIEPSGRLLAGGYAASTSQGHELALVRVFGDPDRLLFDDFERDPG